MKCKITKDKIFTILEWILFIGLGIVSGWFASGVLENFFSQKTSFAQYEKIVTEYPVIAIRLHGFPSEINEDDLKIFYMATGMNHKALEIGDGENNGGSFIFFALHYFITEIAEET